MYSHISKVQASLVSNITSTLTKVSIGVAGFILAVSTGWSMTFVMLVFLPVMVVLGMISGHYWHAM